MSWKIDQFHAIDESGTKYWVANGFLSFRAENRPVQLPIWERWKKWRSFKKQAIEQMRGKDLGASEGRSESASAQGQHVDTSSAEQTPGSS